MRFLQVEHWAMFAAKGEVVFCFPSQYKLCVFQRLVVQQPVQFGPLCRGVTVFVLNGDAVDGKNGSILEPGFYPVSVHVVVAGKQFVHGKTPFI